MQHNLSSSTENNSSKKSETENPGFISRITSILKIFIGGHKPIKRTLDELNGALLDAAKQNNMKAVKELLEEGANIEFHDAQGQTVLHHAVHFNNEAAIMMLIKKGAEIDPLDNQNRTPLMLAIYKAAPEKIIEILLKQGANPNLKNVRGSTPLHSACTRNNKAAALRLIKEGAMINARDNESQTPLIRAAANGHQNIIQLLITHGANVELTTTRVGVTALHIACFQNKIAAAIALIKGGAKIDATDKYASTPLMHAAGEGHVSVIDTLLQHNADFKLKNIYGATALHNACANNKEEAALMLIKKGAEVDAINKEFRTPLMLAAHNGHENIIQLLLSHDANVHLTTSIKTGLTALHFACIQNKAAAAIVLMKGGAKIDAVDKWSYTPLMYAAKKGHVTVIEELLKFGIKINLHGPAALLIASEYNQARVCKTLLSYGARVDSRNAQTQTPLLRAATHNAVGVMPILLEYKADIEAVDKNGDTPLLKAILRGNMNAMLFLLKNGAKIEVLSSRGLTPLMMSIDNNHPRMTQVLIESGADINAIESKRGNTALHRAASSQNLSGCKLLLKNGAKTSILNNTHQTPHHIAAARGNKTLIQILAQETTGDDKNRFHFDNMLDNTGRTARALIQARHPKLLRKNAQQEWQGELVDERLRQLKDNSVCYQIISDKEEADAKQLTEFSPELDEKIKHLKEKIATLKTSSTPINLLDSKKLAELDCQRGLTILFHLETNMPMLTCYVTQYLYQGPLTFSLKEGEKCKRVANEMVRLNKLHKPN